jgi:RNA polymerase subunit RPABC4/transcription elongation factor Spt4
MWCMLMGHNHGEQHAGQAAPVAPAALRVCAHCGYPLQAGFAYCPNCGMSLRTVTCPSCEQAVDPAWKVCPFCGAALRASATTTVGHAHHG